MQICRYARQNDKQVLLRRSGADSDSGAHVPLSGRHWQRILSMRERLSCDLGSSMPGSQAKGEWEASRQGQCYRSTTRHLPTQVRRSTKPWPYPLQRADCCLWISETHQLSSFLLCSLDLLTTLERVCSEVRLSQRHLSALVKWRASLSCSDNLASYIYEALSYAPHIPIVSVPLRVCPLSLGRCR